MVETDPNPFFRRIGSDLYPCSNNNEGFLEVRINFNPNADNRPVRNLVDPGGLLGELLRPLVGLLRRSGQGDHLLLDRVHLHSTDVV